MTNGLLLLFLILLFFNINSKDVLLFFNINVKDVHVLCFINSSIVAIQVKSKTYMLSEELL
ncbi:hypothetical protein AMTRI_Chr11g99410 [Amborella trichopoda]